MKCLICQANTFPKFTKTVRGNAVNYCECIRCGHLTLSDFTTSPDYSQAQYFSDIDSGWESRNTKVLSLLNFMTLLPGLRLNKHARILDYGSGRGLLVATLRNNGYDAYGYEPFAAVQQAQKYTLRHNEEVLSFGDLFDVVTLIEVLEHLKEPDAVLKEIRQTLRRDGYLFISTGIYEKKRHNSTWFYLFPEAGHVSVFSALSLQYLLSKNGFRRVLRLNETMWLFRANTAGFSVVDPVYFAFTSLRVTLKLTNLVRFLPRFSNRRGSDA